MAPILTPAQEPEDKTRSAAERRVLKEKIDLVAEEKRLALVNPGPTWREWVFFEAFKWWFAIAFLILDSLLIVQWFIWGSYLGLVISVALAVYAEFLLYRYLWTRPRTAHERRRAPFRPSWHRPVECGRWTPEAEFARQQGTVFGAHDDGPNPEEFL